MLRAPAGSAEAAADRTVNERGESDGVTPPQTAEEAAAAARAYSESISDGVIERDRAGAAPAAELLASATDEKYDLSRHWRNARTHASHDPVAWKYTM
jgi:hypothetical protein